MQPRADLPKSAAGGQAGANAAQNNAATAASSSSASSAKYLCTLYGLVKYESSASAGAAATSSSSTPLPVLAVAKLCATLRAMCHSDGQRLLHGRQALALLDIPAPVQPTNMRGVSGSGMTPSSNFTPNSYNTPIPSTPASPFVGAPGSGSGSHASGIRHGAAAQQQPAALAFPSIPTFHQASSALQDALATPCGVNPPPPQPQQQPGAHAPTAALSSTTGANPSLAHDTQYLLDREKRLAPIAALLTANPSFLYSSVSSASLTAPTAAPAGWASLIPTRFTRYVRVYRPKPESGVKIEETKTEVQAWREVELTSYATSSMFHAHQTTPNPPPASTAGAAAAAAATPSSVSSTTPGAHESWRVSILGRPLLPSKHLCHVRSLRLTPVSSNYNIFLETSHAVAWQRDYEFVQEGWRFEDREGIEVIVYQVMKVSTPGVLSSASLIRGNRWLCEVRSICPEDTLMTQQIKVQTYARSLENLVRFTKMAPEP